MNQDSVLPEPSPVASPQQEPADGPRPKTARGEATRARILDAAETEFGERGYHAASIASITGRAGVALGTFYVYFPSKEALYRELVAHLGYLTREYIAQRVAAAPERLGAEREGLLAYLAFSRSRPAIYRIVLESQFVAEDAFRDYYRVFAQGYRAGLRQAADAGEIGPGDEEVRAWALMGLSSWLGMRYAVWEPDCDLEAVADSAFALIADGLRLR